MFFSLARSYIYSVYAAGTSSFVSVAWVSLARALSTSSGSIGAWMWAASAAHSMHRRTVSVATGAVSWFQYVKDLNEPVACHTVRSVASSSLPTSVRRSTTAPVNQAGKVTWHPFRQRPLKPASRISWPSEATPARRAGQEASSGKNKETWEQTNSNSKFAAARAFGDEKSS